MAPLDVVFVYNKANPYGISRDVEILEKALIDINRSMKRMFGKPRHLDMREPPVICDIQFHFEIPIYANCPWATINILIVNPEQFIIDSFIPYMNEFQYLLCRDNVTVEQLILLGIPIEKVLYVPWSIYKNKDVKGVKDKKDSINPTNYEAGIVSFLGGSDMKFAAVKDIIQMWPSESPNLTVYTTRLDFEKELIQLSKNKPVKIVCKDIPQEERSRLQSYYPGHLVVSYAEGFSYAAAEAELYGAFLIMNDIPVYMDDYKDIGTDHIGWIKSEFEDLSGRLAKKAVLKSKSCAADLQTALSNFSYSISDCDKAAAFKKTRQLRTSQRCQNFVTALEKHMHSITTNFTNTSPVRHIPYYLKDDECPLISIITPTYNRRKLFDLAQYNLLLSDYPHNKIEWIVVEDSDDQELGSSDKIMKFAADHPDLSVSYVPLEKKTSIGEKRNKGIEFAKNDICLFMDDDDFYPQSSIRRRVSWLLYSKKECVATTMLAMYDLMKGTSAVNVPPWSLPLRQRISEATLTFNKRFWSSKKFSDESIAEGEKWLQDREENVCEIPPQQIIVALSHNGNSSGRRIPGNDSKPGCFWGWPKELIIFLHGLVGVKVEEDNSTTNSNKKSKK
jgi:hypothetical protein